MEFVCTVSVPLARRSTAPSCLAASPPAPAPATSHATAAGLFIAPPAPAAQKLLPAQPAPQRQAFGSPLAASLSAGRASSLSCALAATRHGVAAARQHALAALPHPATPPTELSSGRALSWSSASVSGGGGCCSCSSDVMSLGSAGSSRSAGATSSSCSSAMADSPAGSEGAFYSSRQQHCIEVEELAPHKVELSGAGPVAPAPVPAGPAPPTRWMGVWPLRSVHSVRSRAQRSPRSVV